MGWEYKEHEVTGVKKPYVLMKDRIAVKKSDIKLKKKNRKRKKKKK